MLQIITEDKIGIFTNTADKQEKLNNIGILYNQVETTGSYIGEIKFLHDVPYHDILTINELTRDYPTIREKFNREHTHSDFEMRLITKGSATFFIRADELVYKLQVGPNDLISIPANTSHWFDAGDEPDFVAVRFFTNKEGWEAHYKNYSITPD